MDEAGMRSGGGTVGGRSGSECREGSGEIWVCEDRELAVLEVTLLLCFSALGFMFLGSEACE